MAEYYAPTNVLMDEPLEDDVTTDVWYSAEHWPTLAHYHVRITRYGEQYWLPWHGAEPPVIGMKVVLHKPVAGVYYVTRKD